MAGQSDGQFSDANAVSLNIVPVTRPILRIADLGDGSFELRGQGTVGVAFRFEGANDPGDSNWQTLGAVSANSVGKFILTNFPGNARSHCYRSRYP